MALLEDCCRIQVQAHFQSSQVIRNTLHAVKDGVGVPDPTLCEDIAVAFGDLIKSSYRGMLRSLDTLDGIVVSAMRAADDDVSAIPQASYNINLAGTLSGARSTPTEMSLVLKLKSTLAGRRYRGHNFLPTPSATGSIAGEIVDVTTTDYTRAVAYADVLKTGFDGAAAPWSGDLSGWTLAIYSRAADLGGDVPLFAAVSSYEIPSRLHWLRSRGRGTT
jgi:hypothetical protein